ncbi:MAG: hypothetical protein IPL79_00985 [Myxococcales bacterium]|nr:hypothetical protein [Myxococcales bacterium]
MKSIVPAIGDVFLIPVEGKYAVCKIIWLSIRTKNVFSFVAKPQLADTPEASLRMAGDEGHAVVETFAGKAKVFYTDLAKLKTGAWRIVGNSPLSQDESEALQYHNVGGKLCKGDEEIRPLSVDEIKAIPKMLIAGYEAIDNFMRLAFK